MSTEAGEAACTQPGGDASASQQVRIDVGGSRAERPLIGIDAAGTATAVWQQTDMTTTVITIWASRRPAGGPWSTPVRIDNTGTAGIQTPPMASLAVSPSGWAVVAWAEWSSNNGGGITPTGTFYSPSTEWGAPVPLYVHAVNQAAWTMSPRVAIDSTGNAVAVWSEDTGGASGTPSAYIEVQFGHFTPGFGWTVAARQLSSAVQGGVGPAGALNTDVAMNDTGQIVVVWDASGHYDGGTPWPDQVQGVRYDPGTKTWTDPEYVGKACATCITPSIEPHIALDAQGNATVVYEQADASGAVPMWAAQYPAGASTWGTPKQLDAKLPTKPNADSPRLAMDGQGNAIAVWRESSNDPSHPNAIFAARYAGGSWGDATALDVTSPGSGVHPSVAVDGAGDAIALWANGNVRAASFLANTGSWSSEVILNPQGNGSDYPAVSFMPSCLGALAVWQQPPADSATSDAILSLDYQ
jgi:hypothetical protein